MMHRTSHLGKDLSDPKCQYAMVKKPCFRVWCFEWIRSLTMAYYSILSSKENCPYFMNGRVCKIGRCLKIVLLSNDNLFPFLNHTCSKDNPPPLFFLTLEVHFMSSAQKSGVYCVGGAGCELRRKERWWRGIFWTEEITQQEACHPDWWGESTYFSHPYFRLPGWPASHRCLLSCSSGGAGEGWLG